MKKLYLLLFSSFSFFCGAFAQSAINPVTGGNFDEGNAFAPNGWTVVNSPGGNQWVVGTGAAAIPPSSPNTAYISSDGNPANYSYDNTTSHISHFYQKVTIPANAFNVALNFQLKGNIEIDANLNLEDGLEIYADPSLTAPVADALPGGSAQMIYLQFDQDGIYVSQVVTLDGFAGETFFLIFTWLNNADSVGSGPPASIDGVSLTYCIKATSYNVTGGGAFCAGSSGVGVGLAGSDTAISYQLYDNGNPVGDPVTGTGSAIDFGPQNVVGTYTVVGTSACNYTYPMPGSAVVTETPLPIATAGNNGPLCLGSALNLSSGGGSAYSWTGPNGFTSTVQNPFITNFTSGDAGAYTVTVADNGCSAPATTVVAVIVGSAKGGSIPSASICSGGGGILTLSGNSNSPLRWEYTTDSSSVTWNTLANTTTMLSFSGITVPTFYRAVVSDGCSNVYSDTATVRIHNYWTGTTSSDWNNTNNWSDGQLPSTLSCPDVYIPGGAPNQPLLSGAPTATITNLHIYSGAALTVSNTGLLQIAGTITNGGIFDLTDGTLELNGTATQNIDGNSFANAVAGENNTVKNLIISNNVDVAATANDTLNITGTLSFGTSSAQLTTGNNITLKSSYSATANVGVLASGNAINGDVTVERYINSGSGANNHGVSWQHLATPTQGQSVYQSWMENGITTSTGYGTQVTDASYPANGFDALSPSPSMKVYNFATNGYTGIPNTAIQLYNKKGYLVFVRGDRSIAYPNVGPTVLRSKGTLFTAQPGNLPPVTTVILGDFESVGNPYASAIDIRKIGFDAYTSPTIYVWDPSLTTYPNSAYGYGGFQTLYQLVPGGDYFNLLPTPDYGSVNTIHNTIQSGQGFFVTTALGSANNGTVTFTENAKANGSQMLFRQQGVTGNPTQLRADLDVVNSDSTSGVRDANLIQYSTDYSNKIDILDARKMISSAENLGILSGGHDLVIERRAGIQNNDTIFYNLTGLRVQKYKIVFTASGLSAYGLQGYIEDTYLNTRTPLNMEGSTETGFTVTNAAGSYAANRFRIVFAPQPPTEVALTFISLTAHQQDADIAVNWKVKNEKGMQQYEVETSMDGVNFTKAATVTALNNGVGSYQWIDKNVTAGDHYYRIRCIAGNGSISYSTVVKVTVVFGNPSISIHPNPITDGVIHLQFVNQPQGRYGIRLLNSLGQLIVAKQIELAGGGNATENIQWNYYLAHGVYQLEITRPDGSVKVIKVLY